MKIKLGTYNICHCADFSTYKDGEQHHYPNVFNVQQTADIIKSLGCDVIGLNEVFESGSCPVEELKSQTKKLAELSGYPYYYYAQGEDYGDHDIGNSILSKFPIKSFNTVKIPTVPQEERTGDFWYENRVLDVADIDFNGSIVKVIATHFGLVPIELERIVDKSCEIIDGANVPVCIMGDFNAEPDDPYLEKLYAKLKSAADEKNNYEFTFSSFNPTKLIDYIFVPKAAKVVSYKVHKIKASDHFPITAEIEL